MKKILLAISTLLLGLGVFAGAGSVKVSAEEEIISSEVQEENLCTLSYETYYLDGENEVKDEELTRGNVLLSITEGKVGDEVTALVQCNPGFERDGTSIKTYKYLIKDVYFNGEIILEAEKDTGKYVFCLAEGANVFKVVFDGIGKITSNDLLSIDWLSLLTVDNLLTLVSYVIMIFLSSGFFITWIKTKKIKNETVNKCAEVVKTAASTQLGVEIKSFIEQQMKPILDKVSENNQVIADEMKTLVKCTILSQEDTPEARLAITNELVNLKSTDEDLGLKVKEMINEAIKSQEEKKEAVKQSIEEVKESIESLDPVSNQEASDIIDNIKL